MAVSLVNIAQTLNESADLGTVCTSSSVNQWSFKKPINNPSLVALSDSDYYSANDGFNLFVFTSPQQMIYELTHPNASHIWEYEERTAPYRLTDFAGYDHATSPLFPLTFEGNNSGRVGTTLRLSCPGLAEMVGTWAYFSGVRQTANIVLLLYEAGTEYGGGAQGVYVYKVSAMVDWDADDIIRMTIPSALSTGQYVARLCLSTATGSMSDGSCVYDRGEGALVGNWYAMPPHCYASFTVTNSGGGGSEDFFNYLSWSFPQADWNYSMLQLSDVAFTNIIALNDDSQTLTVSIEYHYRGNVSGPTNDVLLGSASRTLNYDVPWATININYRDIIYTITDANLEERMPIECDVRISRGATSQTRTLTFSLEK